MWILEGNEPYLSIQPPYTIGEPWILFQAPSGQDGAKGDPGVNGTDGVKGDPGVNGTEAVYYKHLTQPTK